MSEIERLAEVHRWLRYAREDLVAAEAVLVQETSCPAMPAGWPNSLPKRH